MSEILQNPQEKIMKLENKLEKNVRRCVADLSFDVVTMQEKTDSYAKLARRNDREFLEVKDLIIDHQNAIEETNKKLVNQRCKYTIKWTRNGQESGQESR